MKLLVGSVIMAASVTFISAQQATQPPPVAQNARILAELSAANHQVAVKNSPLAGEEVNESVQTLFDGNRIVRSSTGKIYRNSEGRVRREIAGGSGGLMGSVYSTSSGVSIVNPAMGQKYLLDSNLKTAQVVEMAKGQGLLVAGAPNRAMAEEEKVRAVARFQTELKTSVAGFPVISSIAPLPAFPAVGGNYSYTITGPIGKYDTRTEELGTRDFAGVSADGTRKTTTIPAGAIGNERPIEIVYERWFSKELGLVVYSKNTDPRFGEQTYKLTNIVRSEPDPSLFAVPTEYKRVTREIAPLYRVAEGRSDAERKVVTTRVVQATTPTPKAKPQQN